MDEKGSDIVMATFTAIVELLVGLVIFVTGMNFMSVGLKESTGRGIKNLFKKINNNKFICMFLGLVVTAIIQSSGATGVMTIGFINASVMSISQGLSVIFGGFIGTTATGILVSLSTFSFSSFLMISAFIGFVLSFFKNTKVKSIGKILIGFGILFFGVEAMNKAFNYETIKNATLSVVSSVSFPLLLLLIGAMFTAITQSSSATNGIVIVMVAANSSLLKSGLYLVLGATIGATLPIILASIGSNINAKKTAFITLLLRTISALIGTLIVYLLETRIIDLIEKSFDINSYGIALAIFTIIYNVIAVFICIFLFKPFEKIANKIIKDKQETQNKNAILYIDDRFLNTPSIAMMQVKKEIYNMFVLAHTNYRLGFEMLLNKQIEHKKEIEEREDQIDYINNQITAYLIKTSNNANSYDENRIGGYFHVINDIERIGDHAVNFLDSTLKLIDNDLDFSDIAKEEFKSFNELVEKMFDLSMKLFLDKNDADLKILHELEQQTDDLKVTLSAANFERIRKHQCEVELSPFYTTFVSELERIADHLTNIGYSVINPTGDEEISFEL